MNKAGIASSPLNISLLAMSGDGAAGASIFRKFTTRNTSGVPTTLGGSPVVSVYKDGSTTQSVAGVTLTADFDSVTGLNHVTIDTSADGTFYANGSHFELVITTGTVSGTSVVGEVVGSFDLAASGSAPTAAVVAAAVWDEILTGATHNINNSAGKLLRVINPNSDAIYSGTLPSQSGMTTTQIKLDTGASAIDDVYNNDVISIITGTGAGQSRIITDYVGSTRVATVNSAWDVQPASGATFDLTAITTVAVSGPVTVGTINTGVITAASIAAGALNGKGDWLTSLGATAPAGWIDAAAIASGALNGKGDWSTLTAAGVWLAGTRTLTSGAGIVLAKGLGVTGFTDLDAAGVRAAIGMDIADLDAQLDLLPTAAEAADKLLGRNIAGGSDGGRTVAEAMAFLRNKWEITGGTLIVYAANDSTTLWTATVATTAGNPVTAVDPS